MNKKMIYLIILVVATVIVTLLLADIYKKETIKTSYAYENFNKITANEFDEYMMEHTDTIIYIADKNNLKYNKFDKKFLSKIEKLNLLENTIYIEKDEITKSIVKKLKENYSFEYNEKELPIIIVVSDNEIVETVVVNTDSKVDTIINYEVYE